MASSLFPQGNGNTILSAVNALKGASNGNPQALYSHMYQTDPQFRSFADSVRGKTPEQAFQEHGFDFGQVRKFF